MSLFSSRIIPLRSGFNRLLYLSSYQRDVFNNQRRFYSPTDAGETLVKGKNAYGDDILFTSDSASESLSVVEKLPDILPEPSFYSQGLGGMSPVGLVQHAFEFLHVSADLPWWGAIVTGTAIVRLCLFPLAVVNRKELVKLMNANFESQKILVNLNKALKEKKNDVVAELSRQQAALNARMSPKKILLPVVMQTSVFMTMLFAMRQMSSRQIESFMTGGLGWFTDLTLRDPLYILPLVTASSILAILFIGRDPNVPLPRPVLMVFYAMCPIIFLSLLKYEAAFTFYLCTNSVITIAQTAILKQKAVQSYFNIHFQRKGPQANPAEDMRDVFQAIHELKEREMLEKLLSAKEKKKENQQEGEGDEQISDEEKKRKRP